MTSRSQRDNLNQGQEYLRKLEILDYTKSHEFSKPVKRINEGHDVFRFLSSRAYSDIGTFVMQLNTAMCPKSVETESSKLVKTWQLDNPEVLVTETVRKVQDLLSKVDAIIDEAPPDTGPRRFGNVSFRSWYSILESRVSDLLQESLPNNILSLGSDEASAQDELTSYLLGGFGSAQRLDYGTGHELSFLAFLACIWKLGGFQLEDTKEDGSLERSIVLGILEPYLRVIRRLILTYTLEPAGSHGVWGLDDHFFLPYIFGSAQYCPAIQEGDSMPIEGSLPDSPDPGDVTKKKIVDRERKYNMYFAAIGFINDVKTGPFWEHSPILFDISGIRSGWGKINKGMIKMYNAEVLSKFPVVQHFHFGSLFSWDEDPDAKELVSSVHTANQPSSHTISVSGNVAGSLSSRPLPPAVIKAPWPTVPPILGQAPTTASWQKQSPTDQRAMPPTQAPWAKPPPANMRGVTPTQAPWASPSMPTTSSSDGPTRAPWAPRPAAPEAPKR